MRTTFILGNRWLLCVCAGAMLAARPASAQSSPNRVEVVRRDAERRVDVLVGGKPFTSYIYPTAVKKPVLFPIYASSGTVVTRGWPLEPRAGERVDHPHHIGLWLNYENVNGLDFWNNSTAIKDSAAPKMGTIVHRGVQKTESGEGRGGLEVTSDWVSSQHVVLLHESTRYVFRANGNVRSIDRATTLTAASDTVRFPDAKDGMLGLRVRRELEQPSNTAERFTDASGRATTVPVLDNTGVTGNYRSSEGIQGDSVWSTRGRWTQLSGSVGTEPITIAILDHPKNVGFPTYWHARGYGLFAANPLGQQVFSKGKEALNFRLDPGQSTTFRYRILVISGKTTPEQIEAQYKEFSRTDGPGPTAVGSDSAQVAALEQEIEDAVVRRDTVFLERAYAPTFRFKHSSGVLEDRAGRMQSLRTPPRPGTSQMVERRVDSIDVEVHGDVALSTGRIHIRRDGPWSPTRDYTIRYARVYARRDGAQWQLVTHHSTDQTFDLTASTPPRKTSAVLSSGSMIQTDTMVAKREPGPHSGAGETTGYSFFGNVRDLPLVFRKRALHSGASIGYHEQREDEIYYVLSGQGELTLDSTRYAVGPGTAILTRPGSSHGIRQVGRDDLVILIAYPSETPSTRAERTESTRARP